MAMRKFPKQAGAPQREHGVAGTGVRGRARVGVDGRVTLPALLRAMLGVQRGDELEIELTTDGRLLVGRVGDERDPDQAWFWTEEWQAGEREVDADIAAGRIEFSGSDEEFLDALARIASRR